MNQSEIADMCPKCTGSKDMPLCNDMFHSPAGVRQTNDVPDGEPSPPPDGSEHCYCVCHSRSSSCPSCVHCKPEAYVPDWGDSVDAMVRDFARVVRKPAKSEIRRRIYKYGAALVSLISERSGAAPEVSPPGPDAFQEAWAQYNKAGLSTGGERVGFVGGFKYGFDAGRKSAEGDTRELKAAANNLKAARTAWHEDFGVPVSAKYAEFLEAIGKLTDEAEKLLG